MIKKVCEKKIKIRIESLISVGDSFIKGGIDEETFGYFLNCLEAIIDKDFEAM